MPFKSASMTFAALWFDPHPVGLPPGVQTWAGRRGMKPSVLREV